jgi:deoxyribonuclease V
VPADEGDEARARDVLTRDQAAALTLKQRHRLAAAPTDRLYEPTAFGELFDQRGRHRRKGGRDEDRVEGGVPRETGAAVADDDGDVAYALAREAGTRSLGEVGIPLDAEDMCRQPREDRSLEPVAGPDLEDALGTLERERLHHPRDEGRLRRHLAVRDRERLVVVGETHKLLGDERRARYRAERFEHALVPDACHARRSDERVHGGSMGSVKGWPGSEEELVREQRALRERRPEPWVPDPQESAVAGCFVCFGRGKIGAGSRGDAGWAGAALLRNGASVTVVVEGTAGAPYAPGLLALREGPLLEQAVRRLPTLPAVLLVDATGRDHPRRAGLALHLGAVLDVPTIGVTHRPLLAEGEWPIDERGARSPLFLEGELVGYWVRTRPGTRPLVCHAAWRTDAETATEIVLARTGQRRTPEPLRQARSAARRARGLH